MKTVGVLLTSVLFAALIVTPSYAQQPESHDHARPSAGVSAAPPAAPAPGGDMPMMDMCRGMMGMPMMGGAPQADPKERAVMLEMRGEMMKAMGEIMVKHARRMHGMTGD